MAADANLAEIAALLGDPARANIVMALMDGRAHTAKELAFRARVSAATASAHLAKLRASRLIAVTPQGRHRYYRIASAGIARMIEGVAAAAPDSGEAVRRRSRTDPVMLVARTCYDHVAGRLGVAIAESMQAAGQIVLTDEGGDVTEEGRLRLAALGIDLAVFGNTRRIFCRPCMDWTERRFHIAGAVGAELLQAFFTLGWVERVRDSRALSITAKGRKGVLDAFGIDVASLGRASDLRAA